jgi:hypothetical protein
MQLYQREILAEDMRRDDEAFAPGQFETPYPGVAEIYTVLDFSQAPEAKGAAAAFTIDPAVTTYARGGALLAKEGEGQVFQMIVTGAVWLPDVGGATKWEEYWLCMDGLGSYYAGLQRNAKGVSQMVVAEEGDTSLGSARSRLTPFSLSQTINRPVRLEPMKVSFATPAGPITFPQMRFTASVAHGGSTAVLTVAAGHGIAVGDFIVPLSGFLRDDNGQGAEVAAQTSTTVTVASARPAGAAETGIDFIVAHRWIRVPVRFRGLVTRVTNFTAP